MRCSICERDDAKFIYGHWHCGKCENIIRTTIGRYTEEDMVDMFVDDTSLVNNPSMDTADYSSCEGD